MLTYLLKEHVSVMVHIRAGQERKLKAAVLKILVHYAWDEAQTSAAWRPLNHWQAGDPGIATGLPCDGRTGQGPYPGEPHRLRTTGAEREKSQCKGGYKSEIGEAETI